MSQVERVYEVLYNKCITYSLCHSKEMYNLEDNNKLVS